jgi:hypothetical protein
MPAFGAACPDAVFSAGADAEADLAFAELGFEDGVFAALTFFAAGMG